MDKKQLRAEYEAMKPPMGVCLITCKTTGSRYLKTSRNVEATYNSLWFQLDTGGFVSNRQLQQQWKEYGKQAFEFSVLQSLAYDTKDDGTHDYKEELALLLALCKEDLADATILP